MTRAATPIAPPADPLLNIEQAAAYLNVSERWLRDAVAQQRIERVYVGKFLRFKQSTLDALIETNTRPAVTAAPTPRAKPARRGSRSVRKAVA